MGIYPSNKSTFLFYRLNISSQLFTISQENLGTIENIFWSVTKAETTIDARKKPVIAIKSA